MKYSKILVPIDFSGVNRTALEKAIETREITNAELTLLHAIDYLPPTYIRPELPEIFTSEKLMHERAEQHLDMWISDMGITDCKKITVTGNITEKLLEIASKENIDLIVMGKHNQTGADRMFGSITNSVVQQTDCDVLVIHE